MPRVGIYCRLSIEDKIKEGDESRSIQNQKEMLREYCSERNWEIFDIYIDDGFSGINRTRPAFNRLLRDCEQGKIDIVLCKDQSRFSRDTMIIEQYLNDKFLEWGIRFAEPYTVPPRKNACIRYAGRMELADAIQQRYLRGKGGAKKNDAGAPTAEEPALHIKT